MLNKILTLLQGLCNALAWWRKRSHKKAREAISQAVHTGDEQEVTKIHHDLLRIGILAVISLGMLSTVGCLNEKVIVVNEPMVPVRMSHNGASGWWLSDALYEATLLKLNAYKEEK